MVIKISLRQSLPLQLEPKSSVLQGKGSGPIAKAALKTVENCADHNLSHRCAVTEKSSSARAADRFALLLGSANKANNSSKVFSVGSGCAHVRNVRSDQEGDSQVKTQKPPCAPLSKASAGQSRKAGPTFPVGGSLANLRRKKDNKDVDDDYVNDLEHLSYFLKRSLQRSAQQEKVEAYLKAMPSARLKQLQTFLQEEGLSVEETIVDGHRGNIDGLSERPIKMPARNDFSVTPTIAAPLIQRSRAKVEDEMQVRFERTGKSPVHRSQLLEFVEKNLGLEAKRQVAFKFFSKEHHNSAYVPPGKAHRIRAFLKEKLSSREDVVKKNIILPSEERKKSVEDEQLLMGISVPNTAGRAIPAPLLSKQRLARIEREMQVRYENADKARPRIKVVLAFIEAHYGHQATLAAQQEIADQRYIPLVELDISSKIYADETMLVRHFLRRELENRQRITDESSDDESEKSLASSQPGGKPARLSLQEIEREMRSRFEHPDEDALTIDVLAFINDNYGFPAMRLIMQTYSWLTQPEFETLLPREVQEMRVFLRRWKNTSA